MGDALQPMLQILGTFGGAPRGPVGTPPILDPSTGPIIEENPNHTPIYGPGRYPWDEKIGPEELEQIKKMLPLSIIP